MPVYDRHCFTCGHTEFDSYEPMNANEPIECTECDGSLVRTMLPGKANAVIGDDIPGGLMIKHGVCHDNGDPRKFYTKSDIRKAAKAKGLVWGGDHSDHVPLRGSDKSPHTTRWY